MAIIMALLSGFAGVYTEAIIKRRPLRNINVQNFWLYVFGMAFNAIAIVVQDFDAVMNKIGILSWIFVNYICHDFEPCSECGIAVSMVMKYADNIVKVYSTSVAMLLTAIVSVFLFGFHLSLAFFLALFQSQYTYTPLGSCRGSEYPVDLISVGSTKQKLFIDRF
ncbi:hypothetical protein OROMI_031433 [Orobanche minor]